MASQPSLGENEALAKMREEDDLRRKWNEHLKKREDLIGNKKMLETDVERMGYGNMTFSQFRERETGVKSKDSDELHGYNSQQVAGLRLQQDIEEYHSQGTKVNEMGFKIGKQPSILSVDTDGIVQYMYMFSPEWSRVHGTSKMSD